MPNSIPTQLRFPPFAGFTVRADFEGGALSSDFGPLLLRARRASFRASRRPVLIRSPGAFGIREGATT